MVVLQEPASSHIIVVKRGSRGGGGGEGGSQSAISSGLARELMLSHELKDVGGDLADFEPL